MASPNQRSMGNPRCSRLRHSLRSKASLQPWEFHSSTYGALIDDDNIAFFLI
eukprot:TRINITY_DN3836_c1_g1_i1.p4 TRINITY_DN3836_c1_g1~~TRINITY_DN3836_c1_g1_i1.p4  ORF type:complete len:52 (-),score=6.00 TRINITY_DN3836_c1_g1_i1:15-170(-)